MGGAHHVCPEPGCGHAFTQRSHCNAHYRSVHGGDRFPCPICNRSFSYKSDRNRHARMLHRKTLYECPESIPQARRIPYRPTRPVQSPADEGSTSTSVSATASTATLASVSTTDDASSACTPRDSAQASEAESSGGDTAGADSSARTLSPVSPTSDRMPGAISGTPTAEAAVSPRPAPESTAYSMYPLPEPRHLEGPMGVLVYVINALPMPMPVFPAHCAAFAPPMHPQAGLGSQHAAGGLSRRVYRALSRDAAESLLQLRGY